MSFKPPLLHTESVNGPNFISFHKTLYRLLQFWIGIPKSFATSLKWLTFLTAQNILSCYNVLFWTHKWTSLSVSLTARLWVCERNAVLDFLKWWPKGCTNECEGVSLDLIGYWSTDVFGWWDGGIMSCVSVIIGWPCQSRWFYFIGIIPSKVKRQW